jgi:hypothetical protein
MRLKGASADKSFGMLDGEIVVRVQWSLGESKAIHARVSCQIGEALAEHGFSARDNATMLLVAYKSKVIDPAFTFHYYGVSSGNKLVCLTKELHSIAMSHRFLKSLKSSSLSHISTIAELRRTEDAMHTESSRIHDVAFLQCEMLPEFPLILKDLLPEDGRQWPPEMGDPVLLTVVPQWSSICESPIPTAFHFDFFSLDGTPGHLTAGIH